MSGKAALLLLLGAAAASAALPALSWEPVRTTLVLNPGDGIQLRGRPGLAAAGRADVRLVGRELRSETGSLAAAPGGPEVFEQIAAPPVAGWAQSVPLQGTKLVFVRLPDGTYAKLLLRELEVDVNSRNLDDPGYSGVFLTYVVSAAAGTRLQ